VGSGEPPCDERLAGSDGLFYRPDGDLVVGNWQPGTCGLPGQFWTFDPEQTDVVVDGPSDGSFAFHTLLHPNLQDFLATPALGGIACGGGTAGCFGVYDHTPLITTRLCPAPLESATNDVLQPVTFIADANNNLFALFNDGTDVQFGGAGFASFDLSTTNSALCAGDMSMTSLIPPAIEAGHSISWDPYLSDADDPIDPHSDFIVFANSRISHIRVDDPGTPGASAAVVSTIDMASEAVCDSLLPAPGPGAQHEFDQGAVTGEGIALVADEHSGYLALVDYRQNTNGTILDGANTVCLVAFMHDGVDDIAPLTGLGAKPGLPDPLFLDGFEDLGECIPFQIEACYEGPPETEGVGNCVSGTHACGAEGLWGECTGWVGPQTEICGDGQDNDCDGEMDNGCSSLECDPLDLTSCNANPGVEACYINAFANSSVCAAPALPGQDQNDPCQFLNECSPGLSCMLVNSDNTGLLCSNQCDPATGMTAAGGNCETLTELTDGRCVALSAYYSDVYISDVGLCIDCALAQNAGVCP
jgi:hypothetical protein